MSKMIRTFISVTAVAAWLLFSCAAPAAAALPGSWLLVSDIHFDPAATGAPSSYGRDTNPALLESSIAEMKRVDPAPPVVFITGDFLAHHFDSRRAVPTMTYLAKRFDRAFPSAQFVITLGNEDSACGDYAMPLSAPFLHAVAVAWEPLVNRRGAAPSFVRTFSRDGFYTARLPGSRLRAVAVDDVAWSPLYRTCGGTSSAAAALSDVSRALHDGSGETTWVVLHIPPGIDAASTTHVVYGLVVVPFLDPRPRRALSSLVRQPRARVALVLAAHSHKFAFRIDGTRGSRAVPIFLVPSVSPVLGNAPSFVTADVRSDGTIVRADVHAFLGNRWQMIGGTETLGLANVTAPALSGLQDRLARDAHLRERWGRLYSAGAAPEISEQNWRSYWCAATEFGATDYRACTGAGGTSILTARGVWALVLCSIAAGGILVYAGVRLWRRRHRRAMRIPS